MSQKTGTTTCGRHLAVRTIANQCTRGNQFGYLVIANQAMEPPVDETRIATKLIERRKCVAEPVKQIALINTTNVCKTTFNQTKLTIKTNLKLLIIIVIAGLIVIQFSSLQKDYINVLSLTYCRFALICILLIVNFVNGQTRRFIDSPYATPLWSLIWLDQVHFQSTLWQMVVYTNVCCLCTYYIFNLNKMFKI